MSVQHALAALLEDQASLGLDGVPLRLLAPMPTVTAKSVPPSIPPSAPPATPVRSPVVASNRSPMLDKGISSPSLRAIREDMGECTRCKLCAARKNIVFGVGNPNARLLFVGEGPGADEDAKGEPFVGKAGQLLSKMIAAMGTRRDEVYICNVVKCRPPNNRDPEPEEVAACEPFLVRQLEAIKPEVVVTLGKHAAHTLLRELTPITRMRGTWKSYHGVRVMPTFHPAYLLRNPAHKRAAWTDLQEVMKVLGLHA